LLLMRKQVKDTLHLSNEVIKLYVSWFLRHRFTSLLLYHNCASPCVTSHTLTSPLRLTGRLARAGS
jgi:hypothetical protein